jgi:hypothetical protein
MWRFRGWRRPFFSGSANKSNWDMSTSEQAGVPIQYCCGYTYLLHEDALGTTTMTTDQNATIQRDETFYPWGQVWQKSGGWFEVRYADLDFPGIAGSYAARDRRPERSAPAPGRGRLQIAGRARGDQGACQGQGVARRAEGSAPYRPVNMG